MCSMEGHWINRGYGALAAVEANTGKVIGAVGLWYPNWPEPEIKWALSRQFWGKGYASEAEQAIQSLAYRHLGNKAPISFITAENEPSIRLAVAVGPNHEMTMEFRGSPWHVYRNLSEV